METYVPPKFIHSSPHLPLELEGEDLKRCHPHWRWGEGFLGDRWMHHSCASRSQMEMMPDTPELQRRRKYAHNKFFDVHRWGDGRWDMHDPFICPLIKLLEDHNIQTIISCQGNFSSTPVVSVVLNKDQRPSYIREILGSMGGSCGYHYINSYIVNYERQYKAYYLESETRRNARYPEYHGCEVYTIIFYDILALILFNRLKLDMSYERQFEENCRLAGLYVRDKDGVITEEIYQPIYDKVKSWMPSIKELEEILG